MSDNVWRERLRQEVPAFAAKVAPLYDALGWEWARGSRTEEVRYVPSAVEIGQCLLGLIHDCRLDAEGNGQISSGGLVVWKEGDEAALEFSLKQAVQLA